MTNAIIYDTYAIAAALHKLEKERVQARIESSYIAFDPEESVLQFAFRAYQHAQFREQLWHVDDDKLDERDFWLPAGVVATVSYFMTALKASPNHLRIIEAYSESSLHPGSYHNVLKVISRLIRLKLIGWEDNGS